MLVSHVAQISLFPPAEGDVAGSNAGLSGWEARALILLGAENERETR